MDERKGVHILFDRQRLEEFSEKKKNWLLIFDPTLLGMLYPPLLSLGFLSNTTEDGMLKPSC